MPGVLLAGWGSGGSEGIAAPGQASVRGVSRCLKVFQGCLDLGSPEAPEAIWEVFLEESLELGPKCGEGVTDSVGRVGSGARFAAE